MKLPKIEALDLTYKCYPRVPRAVYVGYGLPPRDQADLNGYKISTIEKEVLYPTYIMNHEDFLKTFNWQ